MGVLKVRLSDLVCLIRYLNLSVKQVLLLWAAVMTRWGCYGELWDLIGQLWDVNVHAEIMGLHLRCSVSAKKLFWAPHVYWF